MTPSRISALLLSIAISAGGVAWSTQRAASSAMQTTLKLQTTEVPDPDAAPPSLAENRRILAVLATSIDIREEIDGLLSDVEAAVTRLSRRQQGAIDLARRGRVALEDIGRSLGGAATAARTSVRRLAALRARLGRSLALATRIAQELAELDEKLGPSTGAPR